MSKLIPSAAKLLSGNTITVGTKAAAPLATTTKSKYSTKNEATFETKNREQCVQVEHCDEGTGEVRPVLSRRRRSIPQGSVLGCVLFLVYINDLPIPYKLHKLEKGPAMSVTLTSKDALKIYEQLAVLRRIEKAAGSLYKAKIVRGFCHLYSGQEAVAVGMRQAMRDVDSAITSYRCHGWSHLMGVSIVGVLSELAGRRTGTSRGKAGSMHLYGRNFYGGNGIVGAQGPLGAGVAFAHKYKGDGGVCFALYGDGAANQGQLFEVYNMAKLWDLPCVFVCENNGFGMGTSKYRSSASTKYYMRGDYVPGLWVDGMDVLATREATRFAIDYCTQGKGPLVMEMETYRYSGHSMSDPGTSYRTRDEVKVVRKTRDPIKSFREKILTKELAEPDQLKEIDAKVRREVDEAKEQAKSEPEIGLEELTGDVYYNNVESPIRGLLPDTPLKHVEVQPRMRK